MSSLLQNAGKTSLPKNPVFSVGKKLREIQNRFVFATTGANGDQYVLAGPLTINDRVAHIFTQNLPALTSATNANLGFYYSKDGLATQAGLVPVKASGGNELWSGVTLASAVTVWNDILQSKNTSLDPTKSIADLLSIGADQEPFGGIYLVLTLPTAQSAGGTGDLHVIVEEATTR